jgi:hypothetical protein
VLFGYGVLLSQGFLPSFFFFFFFFFFSATVAKTVAEEIRLETQSERAKRSQGHKTQLSMPF